MFVCQDVTPLQIVYPDTALRLQALLDFQEEGGETRVAGDEWLFEGPGVSTVWSLMMIIRPVLMFPCWLVACRA